MLKRLLVVLAVTVAMLGAGTLVATPAHASWDQCPTNAYCVWTVGAQLGAPAYHWTISGTGGICINYGGSLNDNVDSLVLREGRSVTQYRDGGCSGTTVSFHWGEGWGSPFKGSCSNQAWACVWEGAGTYLPSSAWVQRS